ncbi:hypothetical protein YTPLAS18_21750 [Nitrospira sp.]|nr:hypothetical protein YTPLAS18_21750 [Nitrospira sp.]
MSHPDPSASVIVPVLNASRTLPACLEALSRLRPRPFEVLLIDNGSTDGSRDILQAFVQRHPSWVRLLEEGRRGASASRNAGAWRAHGDILVFTDADCAPRTDWLEQLLPPFCDPSVGAVAGRIEATSSGSTLQLFSALYTLQSSPEPSRHTQWTPTSGGFPTANLAVRRPVMERLRGFDESIVIYGEDYDLCARIYHEGYSIAYRPGAVVVHDHRTSVCAVVRQAFGFGRSHAYLLRRHTRARLWLEWPQRAIASVPSPLRGWVNPVSADKKLLCFLLAGFLWRPLWIFLPLYAVWLGWDARRRAVCHGRAVSLVTIIQLAGLHLIKASAMTAGRWMGSLRYGVMCL